MPGITTLVAEVTHVSKHGFCLPMRNCWCPSINSPGFDRGRLNRFQTSSGRRPTISIGQGWTSIYQCSPYETQRHFLWFLAQLG